MQISDLVKDNADAVKAATGATLALAALWSKSRRILVRVGVFLWKVTPWAVVSRLDSMERINHERFISLRGSQEQQGKKIDKMALELESNGLGSVKDLVSLMADGWMQELLESPTPRFVCDMEGNNIFVSRGYLDMVGLKNSEDLKRQAWESFIHPQDAPRYAEQWQSSFKDRRRFMMTNRWIDIHGRDIGLRTVNARNVGNFYVGTITEN